MTESEREEAEVRADCILEWQDRPDFTIREALVKAYAAGRESMRAEKNASVERMHDQDSWAAICQEKLEAEQERSAKLIDALTSIAALHLTDKQVQACGGAECVTDTEIAREAIAQYEASRAGK